MKKENTMERIGFIGTGIMGKSMVRNLLKHGFQVAVYNRTKEKAEELVHEGAVLCESIRECVNRKDAIISIVGFPKDVEEIYFGKNGILSCAQTGSYLIDMTTTSPQLSIRIYEEAKKKGLKALDAPVTGGDAGAKNGTLTILAGGDQEDFDACRLIFEAMGKTIRYEGKAGNGQHTKMCNQIAIAGALSGACEALAYAKAVGLDVNLMVDSIATGAAGSAQLSNVASRILRDDLQPGFFLKHFVKDMSLASEEAEKVQCPLKVLDKVLEMCKELEKRGMGDLGTQALIASYPFFETESK